MHKMKRFLAIVVTVCMLVSILPMGAFAVSITGKPANGTTEGQPFAAGTGGSANFRIPGIATLDNGTLIAACDARWNHTGDGAGLDTIVSVSTDNGENWTYTFANYLGDNGNIYNNLSTCFIDPAIGTDGTTVYLIADLFPAGIALNTSKYPPVAGKNGLDANGNLLLRDASLDTVAIGGNNYNGMAANASYDYYLDMADLTLRAADGTAVEGYTVDAWFNIVSSDGSVDTNLFFSDSPYQPYPTDYLYMTTSTDGLEWSQPTLLNLKEANEQTLLIGPGNGTYDAASDRMIFTAYEYTSGYQRTSLIWMDSDGGWHRTADATGNSWSSEASAVVLDDGTVRCFYRDAYSTLRYTDFVWSKSADNYVPDASAYEVNTAATKTYNNQLSALKYSGQIDGKDVILVSTANTNTNARRNGTLYVFLADEDNSMELAYAYDILPGTDDYYAYSCISETADGRIALLCEGDDGGTGAGRIYFQLLDMAEITARANDCRLDFHAFELLTGDTYTVTDNTGYYGDADLSELDTTVATVELSGEEIVSDAAQLGSDATYSGDVIELAACSYTFADNGDGTWTITGVDAGGNTVYLYPGHTTYSGYPNAASSDAPLYLYEGYEEDTFNIYSAISDNNNGGGSYLYFDRNGLRWDRVSDFGGNTTWMTNCSLMLYRQVEGSGSAEIPGYERVTALEDITEGAYLIVAPGADGNLYTLYPNTATTNRYCQIAKLLGRTAVGHTELTFTGVGAGYTEVQIGSTVYQITVADCTEVEVYVPVGTSVTFTEPNGNYAGADTSALDTAIATVTLTGSNGSNASGVSTTPVTDLTDGTYLIMNTRAGKVVNNTSSSTGAAAGTMAGLRLSGTINSFDASTAVWTITAVDGGYTVQDTDGKYMSIDRNSAGVLDETSVVAVERNGSTWVLEQNGAYLNDAGGTGTTASGWQDAAARTDVGSQFDLYAYSTQVTGPSTDVTFTGVYPGTTELTLGRTRYLVTVTGDVVDVDLTLGESKTVVVDGDQTFADLSALDTSVATVEMKLTTAAHVSNGTSYNAEPVELADCLYTFTKLEDGFYEISATAADGTVVYLNHFSSGNNNPSITTPGKIDVQTSSYENMFKLVAQNIDGSAAANRGLHFHSESDMPYWNRCATDTSTKCHEYLYRPAEEGETSSDEIRGYVLVTDIAEIVDGGQYLIAHDDDWGNLYLLHPSTEVSNKWDHVAKLSVATELTFTGVGAGETSLTAPGIVFEIRVTDDHEHSFGDWTVTTAPTCTEGGIEERTCACGETETREIPALGHTEEIIPAVEATCTESGLTEGKKCSVCGEILVAQEEVPALGHTEEIIPAVEPTCTETGLTEGTKCSVCGEILAAQEEIPALGHDWKGTGCTRCDATRENPFTDVPEDSFYIDPVLWAVEKGITTGTSDTTFDPNGECMRAVVVTFLWRAAGEPEPTGTENPFTDVKESDFFYKAVLWAVEEGITNGISATEFGPYALCNRAQVVTFLYRAMGNPEVSSTEHPFTDVAEDQFYFVPMLWAVENEITNGLTATNFGPNAVCNRAQVVTFLYRTYVK